MTTSTPPDIGAVLDRVGGGLFQQAWIVADLEQAEQVMRSTFGCSEFVEFRMDQRWDLRGERVSCGLLCGFARSGDVQVELIQPISGEGIHVEFLAERGPGPHHLGALVDSLDDALEAVSAAGFPAAMSTRFGNVRITYVDTVDALGVYLELVEDPDGLFVQTMPWRDDQQPTREERA